jgi:UDP-2,3-diacylglucosamine hydrolase
MRGAERALFASDIHMGEHDSKTAEFFLQALDDALAGRLDGHSKPAQVAQEALSSGLALPSKLASVAYAFTHIFLIGDIFDFWLGDDDLSLDYATRLCKILSAADQAGVKIFIMHGNRDFLLGKAPFGHPPRLSHTGVNFLLDPCVLEAFGERIVLTHGDLLCTEDVDYQKYRAIVREETWQLNVLAKPLVERIQIAQNIQNKSSENKSNKSSASMDAKEVAIIAMAEQAEARVMIHGHTHRPALHTHALAKSELKRHVLPDWHADQGDGTAQRGYFLSLDAQGIRPLRPIPPS